MWGFFALLLASIFTFSSCGEDDTQTAPIITLSNTSFTGKVGETASTTVTADIAGEFQELRITKFLGTDIDDTYGTNGTLTVTAALPYTFDYVLNEEGAETPVRFRFVVVDKGGQTDEGNFVITTELTLSYVLLRFNWRWEAKIGKAYAADPEEDNIEECEKDNVFTFNEDGSMSIDYGALTGIGGGTCDFDGLQPYVSYEISADESLLTLTKDDAFNPGNFTTEEYTIVEYSLTDLRTTTLVDLTGFGGIEYDWTYTFKAVPK
ncbi:MAG: hypothetical protein DHS20C18_28590 [Saprospiraceae bacterium]|nr:MAG: hypothetical protein DHS20C18_28590 [Saprospiraceae bacterium]